MNITINLTNKEINAAEKNAARFAMNVAKNNAADTEINKFMETLNDRCANNTEAKFSGGMINYRANSNSKTIEINVREDVVLKAVKLTYKVAVQLYSLKDFINNAVNAAKALVNHSNRVEDMIRELTNEFSESIQDPDQYIHAIGYYADSLVSVYYLARKNAFELNESDAYTIPHMEFKVKDNSVDRETIDADLKFVKKIIAEKAKELDYHIKSDEVQNYIDRFSAMLDMD